MNANEIVLKFTLDIKGIKSALTQVEKDLKNFGSGSEGATKGLNNALEETERQLTEIGQKSKNVTAPAVKSFNQLKSSVGAANGSAIAFNRIIQDAPFGLLGVGNNIQQFTEQLAFLKQTTGSTGNALKAFFSSLITPTNLLILGVSALTSGLTAYQMGAFGAKKATDEIKESIDSYRKSLTESQSSQLDGIKNSNDEIITINSLKGIIEDETLERSKRLEAIEKVNEISPNIFENLKTEAVLAGQVGDAYEKATRLLIAKATAESDIQKLVSLNDEQKILGNILGKNLKNVEILNQILEIEERVNRFRKEGQTELAIANENSLRYLKNQNPEIARILEIESEREILTKSISENLKIALDATTKTTVEGEKINRVFDEQILLVERFGNLTDDARKKLEKLLKVEKPKTLIETDVEVDPSKLEGLESPTTPDIQEPGKIEGLENQIASLEKLKRVTSDPVALALYAFQIANLKNQLAELNGEEVKSNLELVADAFGSLASGISASLNISNRALRGFVTTLISATPKIITAILDQAKAKGKGAVISVAADKKESLGGAIKLGTKAAEALGPVGLALLPVFIAGAVALISGAFSKIGGGGGGGAPSAGQGTTFGNRKEFGGPVSKGRPYIVGEKRPELFVPNTNGIIIPQLPSMDYSGASMTAGAMAVDVNIRGVSYGDDILFTVQQAQIRRGIR
jgi:tetratricopeptide (TPR) repeat protein